MSLSKHHNYEIGACYGCQKCLFCFKDLKNKSCSCDLQIKPSRHDTSRSKRGQQIHNRCYKIFKTRLAQVIWLKERSKLFGYNSNFDKNFDLTLCSTCNSRYDRIKNKKNSLSNNEETSQDNTIDKDTTDQDTIDQDLIDTIDHDMIDQDTIDQDIFDQDIIDQDITDQDIIDQDNGIEITQPKTTKVTTAYLIELKVKVFIDTKKTSSPAGNWLIFKEEINNFYLFQSNLNNHIRRCLDLQFIYDDDYEITYKINGRGQAMCINNHEDFLNFVDECKEPDNLAKT
ncbi:4744_t:CDS:1, partial [Cetraspora pellucida]